MSENERLKPVMSLPFQKQSDDYRFQEHFLCITEYVGMDKSALTLSEKISWYISNGCNDTPEMKERVEEALRAHFDTPK